MIFGHDTTSHDIKINGNVFDRAGCIQNRGDRGGVAVMCPGGHKPSGEMENNIFYVLSNCPAIVPAFKGCDSDLNQTGNRVVAYEDASDIGGMVAMPQLSYNPPPPTDTATHGTWNIVAVTKTKDAIVRYTLDGSRPSAKSDIMPASGISLPWPGPAMQVNVKAFRDGMNPSISNGALVELNYGFGRSVSAFRTHHVVKRQ